MSGAAAGAAGAAAAGLHLTFCTIGSPGVGTYGFVRSAYGVVSPASLMGVQLEGLFADTTTRDFEVRFNNPSLAQNFFNRVAVISSSGVLRAFNTADATFSTGLVSGWLWGTGSNPVWTASGAVVAVSLYR